MKQQLENMMYDSCANNTEEETFYVVGDLESLSATALYTDHLPKMGMGGFKPLKKNSYLDKPSLDIPLYGSNKNSGNTGSSSIPEVKPLDSTSSLIIRDLPSSNVQLHIHEDNGIIKEAGLKKYGDLKQFQVLYPRPLNSYDIAMADLYADNLGLKKIKK